MESRVAIETFDVLILGAGIVGSACALECAQAGLRVGIVECAVPGGATTAAGMGHVVVMDDSSAQFALTCYSRSLWQTLAPRLPQNVEYEQCGTLWVANDDEEMAEVESKHCAYRRCGITAEILTSVDVAQEEPNLRAGLAGGLLVPDDGVIYPPPAAEFFLASAQLLGAVLLRGKAAAALDAGDVVLEDGTRLAARQIVVATGTDLRLLPWLPLQKRKGHLVITDRYPGFVRHQLVELGYLRSAHKSTADSVAFNVQPRRTGQLLLGSSRQYGDEDPGIDTGILNRMIERAQSYMPGLANLSSLRVWTGFRAATPDKLPLIGPTDEPGVFVAVGFEGLGITNAPGAARLLTDHLLGRPSVIDPTPYLPCRVHAMGASHD
ncbi:NAD(P)/FAD-dependent oxidoreductase [Granulicella aggregans]|uniref:NAD(P)/FAD-dependent oxidoreductase n=1 Tax=Granulicella aggregans TaxID=474949 RepID=UPI0021DFAA6B|nr:FAD-dependent oxidoreductase [Granulicella aggregans]